MSIIPSILTMIGPAAYEPEPWGRATGYSLGAHALIILLFSIFSTKPLIVPKTTLTEVKYITKAELIVPRNKITDAGGGGAVIDTMKPSQPSGGTGSNLEAVKSHPDMPPAPMSARTGSPNGKAVANIPMSGPIVNLGQLGRVGEKKGRFIEMAGRTEGPAGKSLMEPSGLGKTANHDALITMDKEDVGTIQKKGNGIGGPIIGKGGGVGSGSGYGGGTIGGSKALAELGDKKKAVYADLKANPLDTSKWGQQKGPFSLEGPLKYRKIVKMELPPYPRWAEEKGVEMAVSIRLWVDPKGRVKDNMYLDKTSGYSELDHTAMEALKKFIFVPIPSDQAQDDEWGIATFRFELKK